jgi:hypothetical protein
MFHTEGLVRFTERSRNKGHPCRRQQSRIPGLVWFLPVLVIRDILVRIRIPRSVPLTYGSGSNSVIRLLSSLILRMQIHIFFLELARPQAHHLQSKKIIFC